MVRQEGQRLELVVLSDLSRALREEEREAWKRLVRVLGHEINNSLAPIKSITASLRQIMERDQSVVVEWRVLDGRLEVVVEDEGPGVSETTNLFVPFYTTKPGGSGIGLVLSRQIVEAHGGTLELENRDDGRGARARLTVPV